MATYFAHKITKTASLTTHTTKHRILCLMANRFRGDIECLSTDKDLEFIELEHTILGRLYRGFYGSYNCSESWKNIEIRTRQNRYRAFLQVFLYHLFVRLQIKVIICSGFLYKTTLDWAASCHQLGFPFIVFQREGYAGSKAQIKLIKEFGQNGRRFEGTKLIVQTKEQRQLMIESGFSTSVDTDAFGIMRMDTYIRDNVQRSTELRDCTETDCVTMFSWGISIGFYAATKIPGFPERPLPPLMPRDNPEIYLYDFCRQSHIAVARYAVENPEVKVVIKAKWASIWEEYVLSFLESDGLAIDNIPNLTFDTTTDAQELILRSPVIIGYGSTAIFEAGILGRHVIVPRFSEILDPKFKDLIFYPDINDCWEIADGPEDLKEKISYWWKKRNIRVTETVMDKRRKAFERYISPLDATATQNSLNLIRSYLT